LKLNVCLEGNANWQERPVNVILRPWG